MPKPEQFVTAVPEPKIVNTIPPAPNRGPVVLPEPDKVALEENKPTPLPPRRPLNHR